jgi:hypothetical protein
MAAKRKMITIPHNGPIYPKGGIMGPITTPFSEEIKTVGLLLMRGFPVSEALENGELLPLSVSNFDKDNNVVVPVEVKETKEEEAARLEAEEAVRLELLEAEAEAKKAEEKAAAEAKAAEAKKQQQQQQQKNKHERNDQKQRQTADDVTSK